MGTVNNSPTSPAAASWRTRYLFATLVPEYVIFFIASGVDYYMTKYLLLGFGEAQRTGLVGEANPIARYFLYSWGFDGLCRFKFTIVAGVIVICQIVAAQRLEVARRLIQFAIFVLLLVILHSVRLLVAHM